MFRNLVRAIFGITALGAVATTHAAVIQIDVIDSTHIAVSLSGTIDGPTPGDTLNFLWVDTPVLPSVHSNWTSITGDAAVGAATLSQSYSGYGNSPYDGTLQLRWSSDFAVGDTLSGTAFITFDVDHAMTQSMFDGAGINTYWGRTAGGVGTLQGAATSYDSNAVAASEPAVLALLSFGLLGVGFAKRRHAHAAA